MIFRPFCIAAVIAATTVTFSSPQSAAAAANTPSFASVHEDDGEPHSTVKQRRVVKASTGKNLKRVIKRRGATYNDEDEDDVRLDITNANTHPSNANGVILEPEGETKQDKRTSLTSSDEIILHDKSEITMGGPTVNLRGNNLPVGMTSNAVTYDDRKLSHSSHLSVYTGTKKIVGVRIVTTCGQQTPASEAELEQYIFGGSVNLVSQYRACSRNQLNLEKADDRAPVLSFYGTGINNGILTLTLISCIGSNPDLGALKNEIDAGIQNTFNIFDLADVADHFLCCLPPGSFDPGDELAVDNEFISLYKSDKCSSLSAQMYAFGKSNLDFGYSGVNGDLIGDGTCAMGGNVTASSDAPIRCFNPAKSWVSTWFEDKTTRISPNIVDGTCFDGLLYGTDSYDTCPDNDDDAKVLIRLRAGGTPSNNYYIGFNGAQGSNSGTLEDGNKVLITQETDDGDSQKIAALGECEYHTISNYDGNGEDVTVAVGSISGTDHAEVTITCGPTAGPALCSSDSSSAPSLSPSKSLQPSTEPSSKPSTSVQPSSDPSSSPSESLQPSSTPSAVPSESLQPSPASSNVPSADPSSSPSESLQPSSTPSAVPSESLQPSPASSNVPSADPSSSPSESLQPSSTPSAVPSESLQPSVSIKPSYDPSSSPSESLQPSSTPSAVPSESLQPSPASSNVPSYDPSSSPSESLQPSSTPSAVPSESLQPSDNPSTSFQPSTGATEMPSSASRPSSEPSVEVTGTPSCGPSASPTESPSDQSGIALWYPNWEQNKQGCFIDGNEPTYMAVNPTEWLSTTLQKCCQKYFSGYYYDQCIGKYPPSEDNCAQFLYYPDWHGSNERCVDDGKEPLYMLSNKDYFLSNSLRECCEKFYGWKVYDCTGTSPVLTNGEYYPDWEGGDDKCTKDGAIPPYMLNEQNYYLSPTLEDCCEKHFEWKKNECMGGTMSGSNKWYVVYGVSSTETCLQDCVGPKPCGGLVPSWQSGELFETQDECCEEKLYWKNKRDCILNSN